MGRKYLGGAKASIARRREKLNAYAREYYHNHKEIINNKAKIYQKGLRLKNKQMKEDINKIKDLFFKYEMTGDEKFYNELREILND